MYNNNSKPFTIQKFYFEQTLKTIRDERIKYDG